MRRCFECRGEGSVRNCDIDDGRQTGYDTCSVCGGSGKITDVQLLKAIHELLEAAVPLEEKPQAERCGHPMGLSGYLTARCILPRGHLANHRCA